MISSENSNTTSEDLYGLFSFSYNDFSDPIQWSDATGISRIKKYPNGFASLYKIGITNENKSEDSSIKQLWVSVSYGKETEGGITLGGSEKISDPVDLDFKDEFSYNTVKRVFYFKKKGISPLGLIVHIEKQHIKPTKFFYGFILRTRLFFWRKFLTSLIKLFDKTLTGILWLISGERTSEDIWSRMLMDKNKVGLYANNSSRVHNIPLKPAEFSNVGTIDFFGYKAKRWSVISFCVIHLGISIVFITYQYKPSLLKFLFNRTTLHNQHYTEEQSR